MLLEFIQLFGLVIVILLLLRSPESVIASTMASIVIAITDVYVRRSITLARVTMHPNQLSDSDVAVLLE